MVLIFLYMADWDFTIVPYSWIEKICADSLILNCMTCKPWFYLTLKMYAAKNHAMKLFYLLENLNPNINFFFFLAHVYYFLLGKFSNFHLVSLG